MLNRRHIRTIVVQSIYSNSIESIESKELKYYINKCSSSSLDLLYCIVDYLKEINLFFNNLESQKFSCPLVSSNPYFFFFTKLNAKSFKRRQIINWDLNHNYIIEIQDQIFDLNKEFLQLNKNDNKIRLEFFVKCYSEIILNSNLFSIYWTSPSTQFSMEKNLFIHSFASITLIFSLVYLLKVSTRT